MTKHEQLNAEAARLTDAQLDGLIEIARYLRSEPNFDDLPAEVRASIERGIADAEAGRVTPGPAVMQRLRHKIIASQA